MRNELLEVSRKATEIVEAAWILETAKDPNYPRAVFHDKVTLRIQELLALAQNIERKIEQGVSL